MRPSSLPPRSWLLATSLVTLAGCAPPPGASGPPGIPAGTALTPATALRLAGTPLPSPERYFLTQVADPRYNPNQPAGMNANCGPASLAMALRAYGLTAAGENAPEGAPALVRRVRVAMTGAADERTWTYPAQVQTAARRYGLKASTVHGIAAIRDAMKVPGRIVVVNLNPSPAYADRLKVRLDAGHFALVTGIEGERVALSDPLGAGPLALTTSELAQALTAPLSNGPGNQPVPAFNGGVVLER